MPVASDEYEAASDELDWMATPDSNAYRILSFLADHPDTGFSPSEIHDATGIPRDSVGTTLRRLADRGLVRHKEPYWAIDQRGLEAYATVLTSLKSVEASASFDWGTADPAEYRIGLNAVSGESSDECG